MSLSVIEFAYFSIDSVSGIIFYDFVAISEGKFFSIDQWTSQILYFVCFLVFVGTAASFTATISSVHVSKLSRNEKPF